MKKFKFLPVVLGMLIVVFMASCSKEGVYNPSKKIQRVYFASSSSWGDVDKYLAQSWNWDSKTLASIDYFNSNGDTRYTENFSYDGNRLTRVDVYKYSEYCTYEYEGKYLKSSSYYYRNKMEASVTYTYESGKLTQMVVTYFGNKKSESNILFAYMPIEPRVANSMKNFAEKAVNERGMTVVTYQVTWTDDNITKVIGTREGNMMTLTYSYDSKNNPFKGFLNGESASLNFYSKNNVTREMEVDTDGDNYIYTYTYTYDGDNYPTMVIETMIEPESDYSETTFYEYNK